MNNIKLWCKEIEKKISSEKKVVLIAGASSSGKSFSSEILKEELEKEGKNVLLFSSDMFYKGISRTIVEKTFLHNSEFMKYSDKAPEITKLIKNIICESPFPEKLCEGNKNQIKEALTTVLPINEIENFLAKLEIEMQNINFDEPFAIDFSKLNKTISSLLEGKKVYIPKYTFRTGECEFLEENIKDGKNFDVILVEGLYTLRDEVLSKLDPSKIIKSAIHCDLKTLLTRRFNRDIKSKRVSFSPEQTIISFISQVMPAFYVYIYPTFKNAEIILNSSLTQTEIENREKNVQVKYPTNNEINNILKLKNAQLLKIEKHRDYFLEDTTRENSNGIMLRLREENGLATKLSIKVKTKSPERAVEEYDLSICLSQKNRNFKDLLEKFKNSGFETSQMISKTRKIYDVDNTRIRVDNVDNLGYFVEVENTNLKGIKKLKDLLMISNGTTKSYHDLYLENIPNLSQIECEMKFKIENVSKENFENKFEKNEIVQYYIDPTKNETKKLLKTTLNNSVDLNSIHEARIRIINDYQAILTLKTLGTNKRTEFEKEIPISFAKDMIEHSTSKIEKTRFKLAKQDGKLAEIDFYKSMPLVVLEIEYDESQHSEKEIKEFASQVMCENAIIEDVTSNLNYKNVNLAKQIGKE